jgi:hypothetical protein
MDVPGVWRRLALQPVVGRIEGAMPQRRPEKFIADFIWSMTE